MASRFYVLPVTVAAGTAVATPQQTVWPLEFNKLSYISVMVPPGHNGNTGIRFQRSTQQVIPRGNSIPLIANSETVLIDVDEELTESKLVVLTYNTDIYDHTFYLRALMTDLPSIGSGGALPPPIIASALLTSAGVLSS